MFDKPSTDEGPLTIRYTSLILGCYVAHKHIISHTPILLLDPERQNFISEHSCRCRGISDDGIAFEYLCVLKIASPEFIDIKLVTGHFNVLSFLHEMLPLRDVEAGVMTPWSFSCQHHVTDAVPSILNNITLPEAKAYLSLQVIDSNESAAVEKGMDHHECKLISDPEHFMDVDFLPITEADPDIEPVLEETSSEVSMSNIIRSSSEPYCINASKLRGCGSCDSSTSDMFIFAGSHQFNSEITHHYLCRFSDPSSTLVLMKSGRAPYGLDMYPSATHIDLAFLPCAAECSLLKTFSVNENVATVFDNGCDSNIDTSNIDHGDIVWGSGIPNFNLSSDSTTQMSPYRHRATHISCVNNSSAGSQSNNSPAWDLMSESCSRLATQRWSRYFHIVSDDKTQTKCSCSSRDSSCRTISSGDYSFIYECIPEDKQSMHPNALVPHTSSANVLAGREIFNIADLSDIFSCAEPYMASTPVDSFFGFDHCDYCLDYATDGTDLSTDSIGQCECSHDTVKWQHAKQCSSGYACHLSAENSLSRSIPIEIFCDASLMHSSLMHSLCLVTQSSDVYESLVVEDDCSFSLAESNFDQCTVSDCSLSRCLCEEFQLLYKSVDVERRCSLEHDAMSEKVEEYVEFIIKSAQNIFIESLDDSLKCSYNDNYKQVCFSQGLPSNHFGEICKKIFAVISVQSDHITRMFNSEHQSNDFFGIHVSPSCTTTGACKEIQRLHVGPSNIGFNHTGMNNMSHPLSVHICVSPLSSYSDASEYCSIISFVDTSQISALSNSSELLLANSDNVDENSATPAEHSDLVSGCTNEAGYKVDRPTWCSDCSMENLCRDTDMSFCNVSLTSLEMSSTKDTDTDNITVDSLTNYTLPLPFKSLKLSRDVANTNSTVPVSILCVPEIDSKLCTPIRSEVLSLTFVSPPGAPVPVRPKITEISSPSEGSRCTSVFNSADFSGLLCRTEPAHKPVPRKKDRSVSVPAVSLFHSMSKDSPLFERKAADAGVASAFPNFNTHPVSGVSIASACCDCFPAASSDSDKWQKEQLVDAFDELFHNGDVDLTKVDVYRQVPGHIATPPVQVSREPDKEAGNLHTRSRNLCCDQLISLVRESDFCSSEHSHMISSMAYNFDHLENSCFVIAHDILKKNFHQSISLEDDAKLSIAGRMSFSIASRIYEHDISCVSPQSINSIADFDRDAEQHCSGCISENETWGTSTCSGVNAQKDYILGRSQESSCCELSVQDDYCNVETASRRIDLHSPISASDEGERSHIEMLNNVNGCILNQAINSSFGENDEYCFMNERIMAFQSNSSAQVVSYHRRRKLGAALSSLRNNGCCGDLFGNSRRMPCQELLKNDDQDQKSLNGSKLVLDNMNTASNLEEKTFGKLCQTITMNDISIPAINNAECLPTVCTLSADVIASSNCLTITSSHCTSDSTDVSCFSNLKFTQEPAAYNFSQCPAPFINSSFHHSDYGEHGEASSFFRRSNPSHLEDVCRSVSLRCVARNNCSSNFASDNRFTNMSTYPMAYDVPQPSCFSATSTGADSYLPQRKGTTASTCQRKLTPALPGLQHLLLSTSIDFVLQELSALVGKSATVNPLYIAHPITGKVDILKELASHLSVRCVGIQNTSSSPDDSVEALARFYCQAIMNRDASQSYRLAGYSYGGLLAFEMSRQLQRYGKTIEVLIMLDGSPEYVECQTRYARHQASAVASPELQAAVVESHFLLAFIVMYRPIQYHDLVLASLRQYSTQEERVEAAVAVTMGIGDISSSSARRNWSHLKSKMRIIKNGYEPKVSVTQVADDIINLKRQQKAVKFLQASYIADRYDVGGTQLYDGDIYLLRIKTGPENALLLPADYGLGHLCTGRVRTLYVDGKHDTMLRHPHVSRVADAVQAILRKTGCFR